MEFNEKLQELRKSKGLTQEELAEDLYFSRTAISKWESGRGLPSIDALRQISTYFGVSIDQLLSGDALLDIAEKEHQTRLHKTYGMLAAVCDLLHFLLIVLPLYPHPAGDFIYSVNLAQYSDAAPHKIIFYWFLFAPLIAAGFIRFLLNKLQIEKSEKIISDISMCLSIITVVFLALSREAYAATLAFLLLVIKGLLLIKSAPRRVG